MIYQINNLPELKLRRKQLRRRGSLPEAIVWNHLKHGQLGMKFRRQHSVGPYILDFYCPKKRLAIELDGETHNDSKSQTYDAERTKYLNLQEIRVLRFQNREILENLEGVLEEIKKWL